MNLFNKSLCGSISIKSIDQALYETMTANPLFSTWNSLFSGEYTFIHWLSFYVDTFLFYIVLTNKIYF